MFGNLYFIWNLGYDQMTCLDTNNKLDLNFIWNSGYSNNKNKFFVDHKKHRNIIGQHHSHPSNLIQQRSVYHFLKENYNIIIQIPIYTIRLYIFNGMLHANLKSRSLVMDGFLFIIPQYLFLLHFTSSLPLSFIKHKHLLAAKDKYTYI